MSWDEIDFSLIVPGMITRGPAEASISNILNQFALAGDERQNLIGENPTVAGLTFEAGEIRNTIFWDKYRDLIDQYKIIMRGWNDGRRSHGYYTRDVMNDPTNYPLYKIDFVTLLGIDLVRMFDNNSLYTNAELFTAEILNAFYTIYENTEILLVDRNIHPAAIVRNIPNAASDANYYYESTPVTGAAGGSFNDLLPLTWFQTPETTTVGRIAFFSMGADLTLSFGSWKWSTTPSIGSAATNNLISKNGLDLTLEMRDLDNNLLEIDYVNYGKLGHNHANVGSFFDGPYSADYPLHTGGTVNVNVDLVNVVTNQIAAGTTKYISISGGSPLQPNALFNPAAGPVGKSEYQTFSLLASEETFIDLNNSALEFYIAP